MVRVIEGETIEKITLWESKIASFAQPPVISSFFVQNKEGGGPWALDPPLKTTFVNLEGLSIYRCTRKLDPFRTMFYIEGGPLVKPQEI